MQSFIAGTDLAIRVLFEVGGEPVVPDLASVFYTIRDNVGAALAGHTDVAVVTTADTGEISVSAPANINGKALTFENRTISVKFKISGQTHFIDKAYRLVDRINMTVDAGSCRSLLGLAPNELPDEDLDLHMAYILTADNIGKAVLDAALIAGTSITHAANRAIACRAILEVISSLQLRALAQEKSQTASMSRLTKLDFNKIETWITQLYAKARLTVNGETQGGLPLLALVTPTDPITGT